jgi:hypothetical protein
MRTITAIIADMRSSITVLLVAYFGNQAQNTRAEQLNINFLVTH